MQSSNKNVHTTAASSLAVSKSHISFKSATSRRLDDGNPMERTSSEERITTCQSRLKAKSPGRSAGGTSKRSFKGSSSRTS